ncbi:MAG TPA: hypothetical protein VEI48_04215 [Candidatus Sulfotelmatobacter sp.]|nr:hypothetical protein [Candidatus Sulfotelmatobacter sp.]
MGLTFLLAACSGSATTASGTPVSGGGATPTVSTPAPTITPAATPTAVPSPAGSAALGSLPPGFNACTLLTAAQATAVNGSTYPAGVNHVLNGGFIECVWQTPTPPSSITLQVLSTSGDTSAQEAYAKAEASVHGFSQTPVTGVGDEAEIARAPAGVNTGGIYVRKGSLFFDVVYLGGTAPTDDGLTAAATLVLGNLP